MAMRISVLEPVQQKKKKSASLNQLNLVGLSRPFDFYIRPKPTEVYVRNRQIPLRSPFRKYERCITESQVVVPKLALPPRTVKTVSTVTYNPTTTTTTTTTNTVLLGRKFPIDANSSATLNASGNVKLVNSFEDLVIQCVDPSYRNNNDVVCYKNRYLVNLGGSQLNLSEIDKNNYMPSYLRQRSPTSSAGMTTTTSRQFEINVKQDGSRQTSSTFRQRSVSSEDGSRRQIGSEVRTQQPPLGTPDIYQTLSSRAVLPPPLVSEKKVRFDFDDDDLVNIELNPDSAEQFIDLLILEDSALRRKIAEGDMDPKTLRKLERLTELRCKYIKYKEERTRLRQEQLQLQMQLEQNSSKSSTSSAVSLPVTQVDMLKDNVKHNDTVSHNERDILIEKVRGGNGSVASYLPPASSSSGPTASSGTTKSIPVYHTEKINETSVSNNISSSSSNCRRIVKVGRPSSRHSRRSAATTTITAACTPHVSTNHSSFSNSSSSNARQDHLKVSTSTTVTATSSSSRSISSLRDAAFSHELKFHPLIKENSYLRSKLD